MLNNYFEDWFHNLINYTSNAWKKNIVTSGECHRHAGPKTLYALYANVTINFMPKEKFEVKDTLTPEIMKVVQREGWYEYIVFGVLDVMLTLPSAPIKNFEMVIQKINFNEIDSTQVAFRLAARDAAIKAIKVHFPNMKM